MQSPAIATFALLLGGALLAACGRSSDPADITDVTDVTDWTDSAEAAAHSNDESEQSEVRADAPARNEAGVDERLRQLDAAERADNAVAMKLRGPEPSEADMRAALEYAMSASDGETGIDTGVASGALSIKQFRKQGCVPAEAAEGYDCDYLIEATLQMQANDGGGVDWNDFLDAMLVPENASGRFVYDASLQRWVRFDP